jgi:hypothetical protein
MSKEPEPLRRNAGAFAPVLPQFGSFLCQSEACAGAQPLTPQ